MLSEEKISFDIRSEIVDRFSAHTHSGLFTWGKKEYIKEYMNITEEVTMCDENYYDDICSFKENFDASIDFLINKLYSAIKREVRAGYVYIGKVTTKIENLSDGRVMITSSVEYGFDKIKQLCDKLKF